jgi:NAD(P)-dependent dehydrogenase (short-subunit alcohol dehydrogenase family)
VTGVSADAGVDIVRAFADHKARLVVQFAEATDEMRALAEVVAPTAIGLELFATPLHDNDAVVKFARSAVTVYGGLDAVINIVPLTARGLNTAGAASLDAIEAHVAKLMAVPCLVARIAANRMKMLHTEGLILDVATLPPQPTATDRAFAMVTKSALTGMVRNDAIEWASAGIRFNAIAPAVTGFGPRPSASEPDVAALALWLASGKGRHMSGHVFEAGSGRG